MLKGSSSAKFSETKVTRLTSLINVQGVVESKNPFGVMIPGKYTVTLTSYGEEVKNVNIHDGIEYVQPTYEPIYLD